MSIIGGIRVLIQPRNSFEINDLGLDGCRCVLVRKPPSTHIFVLSQIGERMMGVSVGSGPDEQVALGGFEPFATLEREYCVPSSVDCIQVNHPSSESVGIQLPRTLLPMDSDIPFTCFCFLYLHGDWGTLLSPSVVSVETKVLVTAVTQERCDLLAEHLIV